MELSGASGAVRALNEMNAAFERAKTALYDATSRTEALLNNEALTGTNIDAIHEGLKTMLYMAKSLTFIMDSAKVSVMLITDDPETLLDDWIAEMTKQTRGETKQI